MEAFCVMRKVQFLPKVIAAAVCLILAIIISAPVFSVTLNRFFGGGIVEFGSAGSVEYIENRPIEGVLCHVIGCTSDNSSDSSMKKGSYYYLVSISGKSLKKGQAEEVVLLKTVSGSDSYEKLNNLFRDGSEMNYFSLSGVIEKSDSKEEKIVEEIANAQKLKDVTFINCSIDCTRQVSSYTTQFLLSLVFFAGFAIATVLSVQSVKRNRDVEDMEIRRALMQASKERKENDANANGADALFGDADRSFAMSNTQQQGAGQSPTEVAQQLEQQAAMQNQNYGYQANQNNFSQDDGFFGESGGSDNKYDGFFGS